MSSTAVGPIAGKSWQSVTSLTAAMEMSRSPVMPAPSAAIKSAPAPLTASLFTVRPWDRGCAGIVSVTRASSAPVADTTKRRSSSMVLRKAEFCRKNGTIWPSGVEIS